MCSSRSRSRFIRKTHGRSPIWKMDGAVVVTPAPTHYDLCREFLEADKDVFVEKPITLHSKDARALADLADGRRGGGHARANALRSVPGVFRGRQGCVRREADHASFERRTGARRSG